MKEVVSLLVYGEFILTVMFFIVP